MSKTFLTIRNGISYPGLDAAPSDPQLGDMYFDTTLGSFQQYIAGSWQTVGDMTSLTGDVTGTPTLSTGATATTIANNVVSNAKLAQMPTLTIKGNNAGGTANAADLTVSQVNTLLGDVTTLGAVGSSPNANAGTISGNTLTLQPASGSFPGVLTTGTQTIAGGKTFSSSLNADGGVDRSTAGTLSFGTSANATTINIGNSGATVNIQGTTIFENTTQMTVADPLITLNTGGGAGSAANSGFELEENSIITGYVETSADRASWTLKAPATAGVATITPGSGGITLNQSSHDPVTFNSVGSSPNGNGASVTSQAITLQPANGTNPGLLTAGSQAIGGVKTFSSAPNFSSLTASQALVLDGSKNVASLAYSDANTVSTLVARDGSGNFSAGTITASLSGNASTATSATNATNVATTATNSTNSTFFPTFVASSSSGNQGVDTATGLTFNPSTNTLATTTFSGALTGAASGNLLKSTGDIDPTSFSASNSQASAANVTGLAFANGAVRSFEALVSVTVVATSSLYEAFTLRGVQRGSDWMMSATSVGDASGFTFSVTTAGQIQYTSSTYTGFTSATVKFRALVTGV